MQLNKRILFFKLIIYSTCLQSNAQNRIYSLPLSKSEMVRSFVSNFKQNEITYFNVFTAKGDSVIRITIDDNDSIKEYISDLSLISKKIFTIQNDVGSQTTSSFGVKPLVYQNKIYELISYGNRYYFLMSNLANKQVCFIDSFNFLKKEKPFLAYIKNQTFFLFSYIEKSNTLKLRKYNPELGLISIANEIKHPSIYTQNNNLIESYFLSDVLDKYFTIIEDTSNLDNKPLSDYSNSEKIYVHDSSITIYYNEQLKLSPYVSINTSNLAYEVDSFVTTPDKKINDYKATYLTVNAFENTSFFSKIYFFSTADNKGVLLQVYDKKSKQKISSVQLDRNYIEENKLIIYEENWKNKEIEFYERKPFNFLEQLEINGIYLYTQEKNGGKQRIVIGSMRNKLTFNTIMENLAKAIVNSALYFVLPYNSLFAVSMFGGVQIFKYKESEMLENKLFLEMNGNSITNDSIKLSSYATSLSFINMISPKIKNVVGLNGTFTEKKPLIGYYNIRNSHYEIYRIQ